MKKLFKKILLISLCSILLAACTQIDLPEISVSEKNLITDSNRTTIIEGSATPGSTVHIKYDKVGFGNSFDIVEKETLVDEDGEFEFLVDWQTTYSLYSENKAGKSEEVLVEVNHNYENETIDNHESEESDIQSGTLSIGEGTDITLDDGEFNIVIDNVNFEDAHDQHSNDRPFLAEVEFTIKNIGDTPLDISSYGFEFYDSADIKGELTSKDFFSTLIQPGKIAKGSAFFAIETNGENYELFIENESWSGNYK